jgi:DNA-binding GntR family transcriptional regulator
MRSEVLKNSIRENIIELILSGHLKPGERIKEQALSQLLHVSRTPLREALISLERLRLVQSEPNVGFKVREMSIEEVEELYPLISLLETHALALSFAFLETQIKILESINESLHLQRDLPREASLADRKFHFKLTEFCKNETLLHLIADLRLRISCYEHRYMIKKDHIERSYNQHKDIIAAIQERNLTKAKKALSTNWESGAKIIITEFKTLIDTKRL